MTPKIFEEALQATARIACCAGLVGLAGCMEKPEEDSSGDDGSPINVPDEPNFDECMEAIDTGFAAVDFDTSGLLECCLLATEEVGYDDLHNNPEYADLKADCCDLIAEQNEFSSACTPWGPPTPPAMRRTRNTRFS